MQTIKLATLLFACLYTLSAVPVGPEPVSWKYKGMTIVGDKYCPNVTFDSEDLKNSYEQLRRMGANSVAIVVTWYQDYLNSTTIHPVYEPVYTDYYTYKSETEEAVIFAIQEAHKANLTVMMKPHIDLLYPQSLSIWRGNIGGSFRTNQEWDAWFASYSEFILKYAKISEQYNAEIFSISCELISASPQEQGWRKLSQEVRKVYKGLLTSSANWGFGNSGEDYSKSWWDEMDFIGIDAYFPIGGMNVEQMQRSWDGLKPRFQDLANKFQKKIVFTEIGYCSGACRRVYKVTDYDIESQQNHYIALIEAFKDVEYFDGVYWWAWNSDFAYGGREDNCISPQWKPAQDVLKKYYGGTEDLLPKPDTQAKCACTV